MILIVSLLDRWRVFVWKRNNHLLSPTDFSRLGVLSGFTDHAVSTISTLLESASSCVSHGRAEWVLEELRGVGESFAKQAT